MGTVNSLSHDHVGEAADWNVPAPTKKRKFARARLAGAYFSLLLFMVVYCARPEDWIPGLSLVPLAKIAGIIALLALIFSLADIRRRLPREVLFLALLIGQLFLASAMSSVWRGGALQTTLDFSKVLVIIIVMNAAVSTSKRLRQLILIQASSVGVVSAITVWKGQLIGGRLNGIFGSNYSNPNDLALVIVISLPLCLALLFLTTNNAWKVAWAVAMLVMTYAIFRTGSRGGFLALIAATAFCLWEYAVKGHRRYLLIIAAVACVMFSFASGMVSGRLKGTFNSNEEVANSYASAEARQQLFWNSLYVTEAHPLFGVGPGNFQVISGIWHESHNAFTQMSSEGGVPALVFYLLILSYGFKNTSLITRVARRQRESMLFARALRASLAGYVVGSLFSSNAYQFFPYFLVADTTALLWIARQSAVRFEVSEKAKDSLSEKEPVLATSEI